MPSVSLAQLAALLEKMAALRPYTPSRIIDLRFDIFDDDCFDISLTVDSGRWHVVRLDSVPGGGKQYLPERKDSQMICESVPEVLAAVKKMSRNA